MEQARKVDREKTWVHASEGELQSGVPTPVGAPLVTRYRGTGRVQRMYRHKQASKQASKQRQQ